MQQYDQGLFQETAAAVTLGGTKKKSTKNVLHVGKIFADWCGHCQSLQPEWDRMKDDMKLAMGRSLKNVHIEFVEIGDTPKNKAKGLTVEGMISKYNGKHLAKSAEKLKSDGYPTLFKVLNGKLQYYTGPRDSKSMHVWFIQGLNGKTQMTLKGGRKNRSKTPKGIFTQITEMIISQPLRLTKNRFLLKNSTRKHRR